MAIKSSKELLDKAQKEKDHKELKDKDHKEIKDKEKEKEKDHKESKDKDYKEFKEKDHKEFKELKEKDHKEFKELKEQLKDHKEQLKDIHDTHPPLEPVVPQDAGAGSGSALEALHQRITRLEKHLGIGEPFISSEERPAVGQKALNPSEEPSSDKKDE